MPRDGNTASLSPTKAGKDMRNLPTLTVKIGKNEVTLTAHTPEVANILAVFHTAGEAERVEGARWYDEAREIARTFAKRYGFTVAQTSGVIAALSPMLGWGENVRRAEECLSAFARGETWGRCLPAGRASIARIMNGENPADVLTSQKVGAFYEGIFNPRTERLTVDGHAKNIADHGLRRVGITSGKAHMTPGQYAYYCACYTLAARIAGVTPLAMQATTWVTYRDLEFVKGTK